MNNHGLSKVEYFVPKALVNWFNLFAQRKSPNEAMVILCGPADASKHKGHTAKVISAVFAPRQSGDPHPTWEENLKAIGTRSCLWGYF